jgi:predicted nucleic acid-binding protein
VAHLLDTNVVIHLRDGDATITRKVSELDGPILLSIISRVELEGGVYRDAAEVGTRRARLDTILQTLPVLTFDDAAADAYRMIVASAGYSCAKLLDRMIGAQALVHRATVVTLDRRGFQDVPGLNLVVW